MSANGGTLGRWDIVMLLGYMVMLVGVGVYFSQRQRSREEYFLAGRRMPWFLVGVSLVATLISTATYVSVPGEMIRYGIGFFSSVLAYPLVIPIVTRLVIPTLMRLHIRSVYEYLEKRYDGSVRTLGALAFVLSRLLWLGLILYTVSFAVSAMLGLSVRVLILLVGAVTIFYTTIGGIRTVIWTDFLQFAIMVGGALAVPVFVWLRTHTGPEFWWRLFSEAGRAQVALFSFDPTVRVTVGGMLLAVFFWNLCTYGADQIAVQRYLSTPSIRAARRSLWISTLGTLALVGLLMFCGIALFAFSYLKSGASLSVFQAEIVREADRIFPRFVVQELPEGISGLLVAAVLAAAMSSFSSGVNAISHVIVTDGFERWGERWFSRPGLRRERALALAIGALGMGIALLLAAAMRITNWNLVELMERVNHLFLGPLGVLVFAGLLSPRVGKPSALAGFALAFLTSLVVSFGKQVLGWGASLSFMWIIPGSFLVGTLGAFVLSRLLPPPDRTHIVGLTIRELSSEEPVTWRERP
jgi:SSS family solute:Na+ symporter